MSVSSHFTSHTPHDCLTQRQKFFWPQGVVQVRRRREVRPHAFQDERVRRRDAERGRGGAFLLHLPLLFLSLEAEREERSQQVEERQIERQEHSRRQAVGQRGVREI